MNNPSIINEYMKTDTNSLIEKNEKFFRTICINSLREKKFNQNHIRTSRDSNFKKFDNEYEVSKTENFVENSASMISFQTV